jgi:plasmid stability protein
MPSLQVRDLPDDVHAALVRTARAQHRSVAAQTVVELRRALSLDTDQQIERRRTLLERLAAAHPVDWTQLSDPTGLVREDRDR